MRYRVIEAHRGPSRPPLSLRQGERVAMGKTYDGPEGWPDWVWCVSAAGLGAWVPLPFLELLGDGTARAKEAYDARELDADEGEVLAGERETCGWIWGVRVRDGAPGWIPREKLDALKTSARDKVSL